MGKNRKENRHILIGHFRYGLICSFGSFLCGVLISLQILVKNFSVSNFLLFFPSVKNILAEIFLTGFFLGLMGLSRQWGLLFFPSLVVLLFFVLKDNEKKFNISFTWIIND